MQSVQSDIMTHRGSHYDLGVETAKWLQTTPLLKNREKEWRKRNPRFDIDVKETYHIFQTYARKYGMSSLVCKMCLTFQLNRSS